MDHIVRTAIADYLHVEHGTLFHCRGVDLHAQVQHEADFRLSLPESPSFLHADLTRDAAAELDRAEKAHR